MTRKAVAVMVCGTTSGAGKSFLATALARWYARQGLRVAPFKAQNMSNNARVVADGEIGSAQYFQALAARCVPNVRMNPVLLKPEKDTQSQVVLLGQRDDRLSAMQWRERSTCLWPTIRSCLEGLLAEYDVVVMEGAGSPAEINLQSSDVVNMRVAEAAHAATLLICDIDRGGAFAHLYGTHQLLSESHRGLIRDSFSTNSVAIISCSPQGPTCSTPSREFPHSASCRCGAIMDCLTRTACSMRLPAGPVFRLLWSHIRGSVIWTNSQRLSGYRVFR